MSRIITITSDWGNTDFYAAAFKGAILNIDPTLTIVDITHRVNKFDINYAAYQIKNCYYFFPKGSIHIIDVNQTPITNKDNAKHYIAFKYDGHYFLCKNNGLMYLICDNSANIEKIIRIKNLKKENHHTFRALDAFVHQASMLAKTDDLSSIGDDYPIENLTTFNVSESNIRYNPSTNTLAFKVKHIDSYGNIITDLKRADFEKYANGRMFNFSSNCNHESAMCKITNTYTAADPFFVFNTNDYLEIGSNGSDFAAVLSLSNRDFTQWNLYITFLPTEQ